MNVETGEVTADGRHVYADGTTPNIIAGTYTNSVPGTADTQPFDINGAAGWLVLQDPPNDGILNQIGSIGMTPTEVGFDIATDSEGVNSAWLVVDGTFYSLDLTNGSKTEAGMIEGANVRDIGSCRVSNARPLKTCSRARHSAAAPPPRPK
ncbi:hypothetical protein BVG79_00591 [Ketogulonicigenium robustum]|uniref:DUF4394 domain-containing protein n=1 Tax=Ketogulonicigenium robustum TaxID=92947 RepID=A0A1W6NXR2_9RHOB|nr:hypothetical protein BVG79_00591 [Ketogulonicigenium robustum]